MKCWNYDKKGNLFAKYSKEGYKDFSFPEITQERIQFANGYITISKKIIDDEEFLGILSLRLDAAQRWDLLLGNIYIIVLALFAGMIATFFLAAIAQKKISGPILKLADKSEQVTKTGDYSIRIDEESSDEVGHLSSGFNRMLEQIQSREAELDSAREQLQTVLDTVPGTISWIDSDLNYLGVNRRLADVFKLKPQDFFGRHLGFKGSSPEFVDFVKKFFKSEKIQIYKEISSTIKDKTYTHLIIGHKYGHNKAAVFIGIDISRIKEAEKAIKESEERLSLVFEASNTGIWDYDIIADTVYYSPRWKGLLGYEDHEIKNESSEWESRIHPDDKEWILKKTDDYITCPEGQLVSEYRLRHKDGLYRWIHNRAMALTDERDKPYRLLGSHLDITERKQAEEALQEAHNNLEVKVAKRTKELADANLRLQELDRLKSMFLASMSHELRTPLNSIIGFTGLLLMGMAGDLNDEQKKQLGLVKNSSRHLLDLINDILDISKIEAGKIDLDIQVFKLEQLINEIIEEAYPLVSGKDIQLTSKAADNIHITSDKRRVKQVLMNLVSNAIKFTESGSIQIKAETKSDEMLELAVIDTGIGIPKEDLVKLFEPFRQLDMSSSKKYQGTGLGLHLCRKLVGLLGGEMDVSSEYGKGSVFIFTLPVKYLKNN